MPTSGLAKGPRTYSGVRSDRNFHSSDSGLMRRSMCSCSRLMVPTASTMASSVLSLALRVWAMPSLMEKSAMAQRSCTSLSLPNSLATTMLPTLSAARSSSWLLSMPSRTYSRLSPLLLPSMAATVLPWPLSASAPSMRPRLFFIRSTFGNSEESCRPSTVARTWACRGFLRLSSSTCASIFPLATPKRSGCSFSRALSSTAWKLRLSIGRLSLPMILRPSNCTSRSIAFHRSVANTCTGSTLPGRGLGASLAFAPAGVPSTGPRSASRSCLE